MDMDAQTVVVAIVVPAVVWLIRLEGRVNVQSELQKKLTEDVTYIRARIDRALNGHNED